MGPLQSNHSAVPTVRPVPPARRLVSVVSTCQVSTRGHDKRVLQHGLLPPLSPSSSAHLLPSVAGTDVTPPIARLAAVTQCTASHNHSPCDGRWHRLLICILAVVTPIARPSTAQDTGPQVPNCRTVTSMFFPILALVLTPTVICTAAGAAPLCGRQPTYLAPSIHI